MATYAARRLLDMVDNAAHICAIELLAAAQGLSLRHPLATSPKLRQAHERIRAHSAFVQEDRPLAPDIRAVAGLVLQGELSV